jgi:ribosomal protein S14
MKVHKGACTECGTHLGVLSMQPLLAVCRYTLCPRKNVVVSPEQVKQ